jgi:hypothetical protein
VHRFLPLFRLLAIAQIALLVRRHLRNLDRTERRRLAELTRDARHLNRDERRELRDLVMKLEPGIFLRAAMDRVSPVPLGRRRQKV